MSSGAVGALVLAAGLGRRMGAPKLALPVDGQPMLARTLAAVRAAGLPLFMVTGGHRAAVQAVAGPIPQVHCDDHAKGLAESLKTGLAAAPADWAGALVVLADMPFVQPRTLERLAAALANGAGAVVPVHGGRRGNPAGFARALWPALMRLQGDAGARRLLDELGAVEIPVCDPGIHRDLDTPADLSGLPAPPSAR